MFKSLKKKPEKAKEAIDFKLKFHATRVPLQGWEKLVISVVSLETRKAVAKTARAVVKNGNCQWQDPIVESTRLQFNQTTNEYEEKFYKLVVSSGSSRAGILGEALINLGEFADFNHPAQRALPLKNCNSGTVLHITITCLTTRSSKRETDRGVQLDSEVDSSFGERDQGSEDDGLDDLDNSESGSNGQLNKERNISQSTLRYSGSSFDSLEVPSTPGTNSPHAQSPHGSLQGYRGGGGTSQEPRSPLSPNKQNHRRTLSSSAAPIVPIRSGWHEDHQSRQAGGGRSRGLVLSPSQLQGEDALRAALAAAQSTIEDLQMEAETAQRHADKLGVDVERLNRKLEVQILSGKEMGMEMSALVAERDQLKDEVERLLLAKQTSQEQELDADNARWAVEEARRSVKELTEEIMFEKETTKNLNLQLRKMQAANMELVLEIEDLEKALEQQREENGIKKTHESPEASFQASSGDDYTPVATDTERKWHERLAEKEDENKDLQAKIASLELLLSQRHPKAAFTPKETDDAFVQSLQGMVKVLQQDVEELEAESNGLTDEIRGLKSRLEISNQELSEKNARIIELETNATSPLPQTSGSTPAQLQQKRQQLEGEEESGEDGHEILVKRIAILDGDVTMSRLENNNHSDKLERAKEMANAVLVQQLMESMAALEKELQEAEEEVHLGRLRIEDLEKEKMLPSSDVTPAAEHETQPTKQGIESTQNRKTEKWAVELEAAEAALEAELADFEKVRLQMADRISELEMQLESTTGECELQQQEASVLKNQVVSLVSEKEKLQSILEQEVQQHRDVLLKLESELGAALEELETYKSTQLHLEERVGQLTGEVTVHVEANEELQKRAIAMEENLQRTMEQVEQLTRDVSSHVEAKEGLQKGVVDLEESLQRALEQVEQLTGQVSYHLEAKQGLQKRTVELEESLQRAIGEVEQLTGEVSGQMEAKEALQKHIGELEENLEGAVQELEHLRGEVSHYEEANVGLQRHVEELEESLQKAVRGLATVAALEAQVTQLQSAYDEQGVRYNSEFERLTQLMEAERQKAEEALQQMSRENATAAEILQSEVAQLTKQLSSTQNHLLQAQDLFKEDDSTLQQHQLHDAEEVHPTHGEQNGSLSSNGKRILSRHLSESNGEIKLHTNILDKHEAKELVELQEKVLQLEGEVQSRSHKIESMIQDFEEKESLLLRKIAGLELAKEQIEEGVVSDLEKLRTELTQLQKQNEELRQQGSELRSEGNTHRMLQSEAEHLREVDEKHEKRLKEQTQNARGENVDERVLLLETELVEAIEAKNMYKVQLQSAIAQQHNGQDAVQQGIGNVDQLIELQKRTKSLEAELRDMQDRYSSMSLRFAEVEAQREELVMVVRNLRSTRR